MSATSPARRRPIATVAFGLAAALVAGCVGSAVPTRATPAVAATAGAVPAGGGHVDNPYLAAGGGDAKGYLNPQWKANAEAEPGGSAVAGAPTAVWLDRISKIGGTGGRMGLAAHLDAALDQRAEYVQFVIANLPGRRCGQLGLHWELGPDEIEIYRRDFVDPIAEIMARPEYASLRIITIIEPDTLPNLISGAGDRERESCGRMQANGDYVRGIQYALNALHAIANVYTYLDVAFHGWIGWDDNFAATAQLYATTAKGTTAGYASVDGFVTNVANYSPLTEPFITVNQLTRPSRWIDWNRYNDEGTFAPALRAKLVALGFDPGVGMLIDTSRNGWGGPNRPTRAGVSANLDTWIDESRVDRRLHKSNWCNQAGAGLGERPRANPAANIDAYVWAKPPGESDGSSRLIPNIEGEGFDQMCDPEYGGNYRNQFNRSGALPDAPLAGAWFSAHFRQLLANAYPPV